MILCRLQRRLLAEPLLLAPRNITKGVRKISPSCGVAVPVLSGDLFGFLGGAPGKADSKITPIGSRPAPLHLPPVGSVYRVCAG